MKNDRDDVVQQLQEQIALEMGAKVEARTEASLLKDKNIDLEAEIARLKKLLLVYDDNVNQHLALLLKFLHPKHKEQLKSALIREFGLKE